MHHGNLVGFYSCFFFSGNGVPSFLSALCISFYERPIYALGSIDNDTRTASERVGLCLSMAFNLHLYTFIHSGYVEMTKAMLSRSNFMAHRQVELGALTWY